MTGILRAEGVRIITKTQIRNVRREGEGVTLVIQKHGSEDTFTAERLLVATRRRPVSQEIGPGLQ